MTKDKLPTNSQINRLAEQLGEQPDLIEVLVGSRTQASWLIDLLIKKFLLRALFSEFYKTGFSEDRMIETLSSHINKGSDEWERATSYLKKAEEISNKQRN